jgi:hypothetical protein
LDLELDPDSAKLRETALALFAEETCLETRVHFLRAALSGHNTAVVLNDSIAKSGSSHNSSAPAKQRGVHS